MDGAAGLAAAEEAPPSPDAAAFHGFPLEPFSMRAEREAAGGRRPREHDAWVAGLPGGGEEDDAESSSGDDDDDDGAPGPPRDPVSTDHRNALRLRLARLLKPHESPVAALRRLAAPTPPGSRLPRLTVPPGVRAEFDEISALADQLMAAGDVGCHTSSKERLVAATGARADAGARDGDDDGGSVVAALEAAAAAVAAATAGAPQAAPVPQHDVPPDLAAAGYRPAHPSDGDEAGAPPGLLYSSSRGLWVDPSHPGVVRCAATGRWKRARAITDDGGGSGTPLPPPGE